MELAFLSDKIFPIIPSQPWISPPAPLLCQFVPCFMLQGEYHTRKVSHGADHIHDPFPRETPSLCPMLR